MTECLRAMQENTQTQIGTLVSQMDNHQARREVIQEKRIAYIDANQEKMDAWLEKK
jgi:ABC-type proline/glycine betaine transport system substrate-binding protein